MTVNRKRIIDAAVPVFASKGRYRTHMDDIASYAHMNKAMIYYFYHSKDELYFDVIRHVFERLIESFITAANSYAGNDRPDSGIQPEAASKHMSFFKDNQYYMKILIDALSNGPVEAARAVSDINEAYKERDVKDLFKNILDRMDHCGSSHDAGSDRLMTDIFAMLITRYLPVYMHEHWSVN